MKRRSRILRDLGSRKYSLRVLPNKKRAARNEKVIIDADTWAESGGTIGIFGKAWAEGRLKIVSEGETQ